MKSTGRIFIGQILGEVLSCVCVLVKASNRLIKYKVKSAEYFINTVFIFIKTL